MVHNQRVQLFTIRRRQNGWAPEAPSPLRNRLGVGFFYKALCHRTLAAEATRPGPDPLADSPRTTRSIEFKEIAALWARAGVYKSRTFWFSEQQATRATGISVTISQRETSLAAIATETCSAGRLNRTTSGAVSAPRRFQQSIRRRAPNILWSRRCSARRMAQHFTSSQVSAIDGAAVHNACRWVRRTSRSLCSRLCSHVRC